MEYEHEQDDPAYWLEGLEKKVEALRYRVTDARKALEKGDPVVIQGNFDDLENEEERVHRCVEGALYAWRALRERIHQACQAEPDQVEGARREHQGHKECRSNPP